MRIRARSEWGAAPPRSVARIGTPTPRLWLHHTAGQAASTAQAPAVLRQTQRFHQQTRRWQDIAYSFLVDTRGGAWTGRGPGVAGGHTAGDNSRSHAICAMGNFDVQRPSSAMIQGIADLVRHGAARGWWPPQITGGHRQAPGASTACPGRHLQAQIPEIKRRARSTATLPPPPPPVPSGGFLMALTAAQQREILGHVKATSLRMVEQQARMADQQVQIESLWAWVRTLAEELPEGSKLGHLRPDIHQRVIHHRDHAPKA